MLVLLSLFACTGSVSEPPSEPAAVVAEAVAPSPQRFVLASRLNLRDAPGGNKIGKLRINSPVQLLKVEGDQAHIRVGNGKEGWVPTAYLTEGPTTIPLALKAAKEAASAEDRLAWTQRAAALDFRSRDALSALALAYRESGRAETAAQIESQLAWPDDILLAGAHAANAPGLVRLEWATVPWEEVGSGSVEPAVLSEAQMARKGVKAGSEIWVLPTKSKAIKGTVAAMELINFNECGGEWGWVIDAKLDMPDGERALAYTIETPPDAWMTSAPVVDEAAIEKLARDAMPLTVTETEVHVAAYREGARVRIGGLTNGVDDDMPTFAFVDFDVSAEGELTEVHRAEEYYSYLGFDYPSAGRDFDGDGNIDLFIEGLCAMELKDHTGVTRAGTAMLCCGC